jgi:hypothetical protein
VMHVFTAFWANYTWNQGTLTGGKDFYSTNAKGAARTAIRVRNCFAPHSVLHEFPKGEERERSYNPRWCQ